jgi:hypothetical protein
LLCGRRGRVLNTGIVIVGAVLMIASYALIRYASRH